MKIREMTPAEKITDPELRALSHGVVLEFSRYFYAKLNRPRRMWIIPFGSSLAIFLRHTWFAKEIAHGKWHSMVIFWK
jgi:hypothetical protein